MADENSAYVVVRMRTLLRIPGIVNIWTQAAGQHRVVYFYFPRRAFEWRIR